MTIDERQDFPALTLRDIYGALAYYLDHQKRVEEYLRKRENDADEVRCFVEAREDINPFAEGFGIDTRN